MKMRSITYDLVLSVRKWAGWITLLPLIMLFAPLGSAYAATNYYVWKDNPSPNPPFTNWTMAATSIQDAVDLTINGDRVEVTNGTYDTGGRVTPGYSLTNRVCITKAITLRSINGAGATIIAGAEAPGGGMGTGAVRCVYMTNAASLIGFSLTNGHTMTSGDGDYDQKGAGVFLHNNAVVSNCIIRGNSAYSSGAGVCLYLGGTMNNCVISWNTSAGSAGGALVYGGYLLNPKMNNCLILGNTGISAAGVYLLADGPEMNNCTVVSNTATTYGGGGLYSFSYAYTVSNCIVWGNRATAPAYESKSNILINTTVTNINFTCSGPAQLGTGNIGADPLFVNSAAANYRLAVNSSCINAGANNSWMTNAVDLDGHVRIRYGRVDMGAYERIYDATIYNFH